MRIVRRGITSLRAMAGLALAGLALGGCGATAASPAAREWRVAYTGYGTARASGARSFFLEPARPQSAAATHAALILSPRSYGDFTLVARLRTTRQLRTPRANAWEVGWLLWHYTGEQHFYYLILKPNGFELGKEDPAYPGQQRFLVTGNQPRFPAGRWYVVRVTQRGDVLSVSVNGRALVRYADTRDPYRSGRVGLYSEDAAVTYQLVDLTPSQ